MNERKMHFTFTPHMFKWFIKVMDIISHPFFLTRDRENALKLQEQRRQKAIEEAEKSHQKHSKYLQETVNK